MDSAHEPQTKRLKVENGHSARNGQDNMMVFPRDDDSENVAFGEHDITLIVGDKSFRCHKRVLSQHSKYFNAMFSHPMRESKADEVTLQDVSREAAEVLFSYIYSKDHELDVDAFSMGEVIAMATMLQMDSAVDLCSALMLENMGPENCLGFMQVAQENFLPEVYRRTRVCAVSNFSTVVRCTEFCQLSVAQLKNYLSDEYLNTTSELEVFGALMDWYGNWETASVKPDKSVDLQDLMDTCLFHGDLDLLSVESMLEDESVCQSAPLKSYAENLKKIKMQSNQGGTKKKERCRKRSWQILCVGCSDEGKAEGDNLNPDVPKDRPLCPYSLHSCEEHNHGDGPEFHMRKLCGIPFQTSSDMGLHMCASDMKVFLSGGEVVLGRNTWNLGVWQLDTTTQQWSKIGDLTQPRRHHASCCYGDLLLVVGGFGRYRTIQDSVESLNLTTGKWLKMAPMRYPEFSPTVVLMGDRMLIFKSHVQQYDLVSQQCTAIEWDQQTFPLRRMLAFPIPDQKVLYACQTDGGKVFRLTMGVRLEMEEVGDVKGAVNTCALVGKDLLCFQTDENKQQVSIFSKDLRSVRTQGLKGVRVNLSSLAVAVPKYPDYQL